MPVEAPPGDAPELEEATKMATPGLEHEAERAKARQGFLLGLPTIVYLPVSYTHLTLPTSDLV